MKIYEFDKNYSLTIQVTDANSLWRFDAGATVAVSNGFGVYNSGYKNVVFHVAGDIGSQSSQGYAGLVTYGDDNIVNVADGGSISGPTAVIFHGPSDVLHNRGVIDGKDAGITGDGAEIGIVNSGKVTAAGLGTGIDIAGDSGGITNTAGGMIKGDTAIHIDDVYGASIENGGTIDGKTWSIVAGDGPDTLTNTGNITGFIDMGGGNDIFNLRHGTVDSDIFGGTGDDWYFVDDPTVSIYEYEFGGTSDRIYARCNFKLAHGQYIEDLVADSHKGNFALTGNELNNYLQGNEGNNRLRGGGGDDWISGDGGTDHMRGGGGGDTFWFGSGSAHDTIMDMDIKHADHDIIDLSGVSGISSFDDLKPLMSEHQGNTIIHFGDGDRLVLDGIDKGHLATSDFSF